MKCYCISGLGADKRAFKYLSINHELIHVEWIKTFKNESTSSYSKRLSEQINTDEPFLLLGLSFGGLIAGELAKLLHPEKVIHISSITNKRHLPFLFRLIGATGIHKLIPASLMSPPMGLANWFFGIKNPENKKLLKEIIDDTDKDFLKWAIGRLLSDEVIVASENLIRIHGTNDKLLPLREKDGVIKIDGGGHFMVIEQADEVSKELNNIL
jgi:pimeloyl-ACP methyl ester carboxylesterase